MASGTARRQRSSKIKSRADHLQADVDHAEPSDVSSETFPLRGGGAAARLTLCFLVERELGAPLLPKVAKDTKRSAAAIPVVRWNLPPELTTSSSERPSAS
eukprot:CAMPEP_0177527904 /NCGR_PEP_ID=MMETSP0369-20130122/51926_1 /TAXON_ID=447022 ORGANISM="Scrippsiella hangoei-like, Strain SHHI-4" /NCGR_SAMPLE_ID=MMETSP0369 /ASSEMBLY_ACC=CAM_ASM_000364 /LENGTH=100 /DNA_ID=CAMNT_0019008347 /DNA_START=335 /DNA_END=638 /DNA_ORIENTATION=+